MKKIIYPFLVIFSAAIVTSMALFIGPSQALNAPGVAKFYATTANSRTFSNDSGFTFAKRISLPSGKIIGNSFMVCTRIANRGEFGFNVRQCTATFNLPRGRISVAGSLNSLEQYNMVVTGGTGFYNNVGGKLDVFLLGTEPRTERVIFTLYP